MNLQSQRHLVIVCFQRLDSGFGFRLLTGSDVQNWGFRTEALNAKPLLESPPKIRARGRLRRVAIGLRWRRLILEACSTNDRK